MSYKNVWIGNYIHYKVWDELTYQLPNFNEILTIDKSNVHSKGLGQISKFKANEVKTNFAQLGCFCGPFY